MSAAPDLSRLRELMTRPKRSLLTKFSKERDAEQKTELEALLEGAPFAQQHALGE